MLRKQTKTKLDRPTQPRILLVEFKAPKELVEAFDHKLKSQYSSRSEAIRSLMRNFLESSEKGMMREK